MGKRAPRAVPVPQARENVMKHWLVSGILVALMLPTAAAEGGGVKRSANVGGLDGEGATVTGVVKFSGPQPPRKPISGMSGNAYCNGHCGGNPPLDEKWVFGKNGDDATFAN